MASSDAGLGACRWCRRSKTAPNPFTVMPWATHTSLPFRCNGALECTPCRNYIHIADLDKTDLAESLKQPGELDQYVTKVDGDITPYNTNANGRVYKKDIDKYNTQIFSAAINEMKMTKNLWILWPIYKSIKKTDPPKAKVIKAKVEGKQVARGLIDIICLTLFIAHLA
jgi:hypothetical protein